LQSIQVSRSRQSRRKVALALVWLTTPPL
jgi:hypothetical protein